MSWTDIFYLLVGVGIGLIASRKRFLPASPRSNAIHRGEFPHTSHHSPQVEQLQLAYHLASEMSAFKGGFLARVSHELRSPLNGLIGMQQLILNDLCDSPEEERECIQKAHQSALKLMKFIDEMVMVSKTEHGTDKLDLEPIDLAQLFQEVKQLTYHQAANRNLQLQIIPPESETYVLADRRRLRQVLINLIDTAIAQMHEGNIRLTAQSALEEGLAYIWLEDARPVTAWQEPVNLLTLVPPEQALYSFQSSPGLTLMVDKILLELMQGKLEVLYSPIKAESEQTNGQEKAEKPPLNRIQCLLPLAATEADL